MMTPENSIQRYKKTGGKDGFDCRACHADAAKKWRIEYKDEINARLRLKRRIARAKLKGLPISDLEDSVKSDPLTYLKLSPTAAQAETDFGFAVEKAYENGEGLPLCFDNPAPYTDYPENNPPSMVQAALLCLSCPVFEMCHNYAEALKPTSTIMAGERWIESSKIGVGEKAYK